LVLLFVALFPLLLTGLASAEVSSKVALTPALARWKADIEATGKTTVVLARVFTDANRNELVLPEDAEFRPFLRRLLSSESFVTQFVQTHAMNVNADTGLRPISAVFLNMALAADWEGQEDAVIAHELGHIWLHARGYEAVRVPGGLSCEAVHAGDIVQHILIREQMRARRIDFLPFWIRTLESALEQMTKQSGGESGTADRCRHIARLALWVDVDLGLTDREWPRRQAMLSALRKSFPQLEGDETQIAAMLRGRNLRDYPTYRDALRAVFFRVQRVENSKSPDVE
jgi:hypothetical protein